MWRTPLFRAISTNTICCCSARSVELDSRNARSTPMQARRIDSPEQCNNSLVALMFHDCSFFVACKPERVGSPGTKSIFNLMKAKKTSAASARQQHAEKIKRAEHEITAARSSAKRAKVSLKRARKIAKQAKKRLRAAKKEYKAILKEFRRDEKKPAGQKPKISAKHRDGQSSSPARRKRVKARRQSKPSVALMPRITRKRAKAPQHAVVPRATVRKKSPQEQSKLPSAAPETQASQTAPTRTTPASVAVSKVPSTLDSSAPKL